MRAGNYGLIAAEAGLLGICWSNTLPNMPAWGSSEARIGNNPLVLALPAEPHPVLLDMSMSLFSYGKLATYRRLGKPMPFDCGFDREGNSTRDPAKVLEIKLPLSMGYWKGAGLSIVLDLFASILSDGLSTQKIGELPLETSLSQVFIAVDPRGMLSEEALQAIVSETLAYVAGSKAMPGSPEIRYPGQRSFRERERQLREGIEVDDGVWQAIVRLPA
jgi:3-dehydro-L-gulonate 2-dehydrogenase